MLQIYVKMLHNNVTEYYIYRLSSLILPTKFICPNSLLLQLQVPLVVIVRHFPHNMFIM